MVIENVNLIVFFCHGSKTEIEAEIRQHVVAEERAYRWVEHLAMTESISQEEIKIMVDIYSLLVLFIMVEFHKSETQ